MPKPQTDLSLASLDDISPNEIEEARIEVLKILAGQTNITAWIKNPPEWWVVMYVLDPTRSIMLAETAFEMIPARPGWYKAIHPLLFHHMMIIGRVDDSGCYEDRWCYDNFERAIEAFKTWDGIAGTEPEGWHKHPLSGRTRMKMSDGSWIDTTGKIEGIDFKRY